MNIVKAITRNARIAGRKIRPLTFSVVNKSATEAVDILTFMPRKGAAILLKTLKSAIANAENNHNLSAARLFVQEAHVDDGRVLKRAMPQARGSAHTIHKCYSHVRIVLSDGEIPAKKETKRQKAIARHKAAKAEKSVKSEEKGNA
jgi:large subunit ribosomal protein L22